MHPLIPDDILEIIESHATSKFSQREIEGIVRLLVNFFCQFFSENISISVFFGVLQISVTIGIKQFPIRPLMLLSAKKVTLMTYQIYNLDRYDISTSMVEKIEKERLDPLKIIARSDHDPKRSNCSLRVHRNVHGIDIHELWRLNKEKTISMKRTSFAEEENLYVVNYTKNAVYSKDMIHSEKAQLVRQCRGLVCDENYVYALPWSKFFNYGEEGCPEIPEGNPIITVKYDGSFGIFVRYGDKNFWTTRGDADSRQAAAANRMWSEMNGVFVPFDWTLMAEIIHPDTKNIVHYDFEGLVILGARNLMTGDEIPYEEVASWANQHGLRMTERIEGTFQEICEKAKSLDDQHEGFVLAWPTPTGEWTRIKIKSSEYVRVHRLVHQMTDRRIGNSWYFGDLQTSYSNLPEEVVDQMKEIAESLDRETNTLVDRIYLEKNEILEFLAAAGVGPSLKEIAGRAKSSYPEDFHILMEEFRGKKVDYKYHVFVNRFGRHPSKD